MIPSSKEERRADIVEYYKERITPYYSLRWHLGIMAYSNLIIILDFFKYQWEFFLQMTHENVDPVNRRIEEASPSDCT